MDYEVGSGIQTWERQTVSSIPLTLGWEVSFVVGKADLSSKGSICRVNLDFYGFTGGFACDERILTIYNLGI